VKEDACQLACAAYMKSATPENPISDFKKTGIFPLNRDILDSKMFAAPAELFHNENINATVNEAVVNESQSVVVEVEEGSQATEEEEGGMDELWTHLMLCTDVRVVRTGSEFLCVHCN
jgi:hypothetical protein